MDKVLRNVMQGNATVQEGVPTGENWVSSLTWEAQGLGVRGAIRHGTRLNGVAKG